MKKNHEIKFRVTKIEKQKIHNKAREEGYSSASDYARSKLLGESVQQLERHEKILQEILRKVC